MTGSDINTPMTGDRVMDIEDRYQIPTYRKMPIAVDRGEGCWIFDADGRRYLDLYGGHCVALLGHSHPRLVAAIAEQAGRMLFYSNAVYSTVRARAARALGEAAPDGMRRTFFCNSGTEANEAALKLARKATGRPTVVAMQNGFHGRTLGSLAATWSSTYRDPYRDALGPTEFVPFGDAVAVERLLASRDDVAAVIIEPMQSMAGVTEASPDYFRALRAACTASGVVLIFDEIQTGVGRTGTFSISEQFDMTPDLITLAKSLGGGVPVGAVLVSDALADSVGYGDQGTTFGGGMLAMAAVETVVSVLRSDGLMERAVAIERRVRARLTPHVHGIRGKGCLLGLDLGEPAKPTITALRERGMIMGGATDPHVIRLMPPLVTPDDALDLFFDSFIDIRSQ